MDGLEGTHLVHIDPITPVAGFCSAKLARRAAAAASVEFLFWFTRPEKRVPWDGCDRFVLVKVQLILLHSWSNPKSLMA